jgi:ParB family chromosome partitioning protein
MPSSPPRPFGGRARVTDLHSGSVFELRTEAVLSSASPVSIDSIEPNPRNPRQVLARDQAFDELVESIRQHGLLQPILVRRGGIRRVLIAGHRRLAAVQRLAAEAPEDPRWRKILAVERTVDEDEAFVLALVENLHREDLPAEDEATALEALEHQLGSLQAVADAIKRSKAYVSRRIRIYQDPLLAAAILDHGLARTTAQEFLPVKDARQRGELIRDALRERWDAPQARAEVRNRCESQQAGTEATRCDSQQPRSDADARSTGERAARGRAIRRHVHALRRLIGAGPADDLSARTLQDLRALAGQLHMQFKNR